MMLVSKNERIPAFPNLINDIFENWNATEPFRTRTNMPSVNVAETETAYEVDLAAPGMEKKDFKIEVDKNVLTISSEKSEETESTEKNYSRKEYSYSAFKRRFNLPKDTVDEDKIEATYINGELKIVLPKREAVQPKALRAIEVK